MSECLVVVDVQNDFCGGGALPVPEGDKIVPRVNEYVKLFTSMGMRVFATRDWHPQRTSHFNAFGGTWPAHCVEGTSGAEFHPGLILPGDCTVITKGDGAASEGYSGFDGHDREGRAFARILKDSGIKRLYVCGLATDYCVKATVLDAIKEGFQTVLLIDAIRGVDLTAGDSKKAIVEMIEKGAETAAFQDVLKFELSLR